MTVTHYHTLESFQNFFNEGIPVLTYHKVGPRPSRVRMKGLYVSPSRFCKQMEELHDAGFTTAPVEEATSNSANPNRRIVITFDDGFRNAFEHTLEPLKTHQFRAIQFLVANLIGKINEWDLRSGETPELLMDAVQVREWLAAGHQIGSHSLTHPHLNRLTLRDAQEEIVASKKKLEDTFGVPVVHFCYPYGDLNPAVRDLVQEAGYQTACTTEFGINNSQTHAYSIKRISVRYPSRSLKALKARILEWSNLSNL